MDDYKEIKRKINLANAYLEDMNNFVEDKLEKLNIKHIVGERKINGMSAKTQQMLQTEISLIEMIEDIEMRMHKE